jgi:hypothetical protein
MYFGLVDKSRGPPLIDPIKSRANSPNVGWCFLPLDFKCFSGASRTICYFDTRRAFAAALSRANVVGGSFTVIVIIQ